jgi:hypothetical protein
MRESALKIPRRSVDNSGGTKDVNVVMDYRHVCHRLLYFTIIEAKKDEANSTLERLRLYASVDHVNANVEL